ncbi:MAG TPA: DUF4013 domain-containing protein [Thermoanaerobaculia bacterium]|nr:DUF4013 domain-containing protein [Thermoanaerobaculia bacterium]
MFEDPNWVTKILLGGVFFLLSFLLIGIFFISGYIAQLVRNVIDGKQHPLPEWDTLGEYFTEGLMLFCVGLLYSLPIIVAAFAIGIPSTLLNAVEHEGARNLGGGVLGCASCMVVPFAMAIMFFMPAGLLMAVTTRRFGAAFEFGRVWEFIRDNIGNYLLAIVIYIVARFIASFGIILLCIGVIFTDFWALTVSGFAFAQVYRMSVRR